MNVPERRVFPQCAAVLLFVLPAMFSAFPLHAALVVSIADSPDRDAMFLVQTSSNHARIHGSHTNSVDERFLHPGETAASRH